MDAIDILGGLLGQKSNGSRESLGGKILKDILGGALGGSSGPAPRNSGPAPRTSAPSRETSQRGGVSGMDIEAQARELEDLLNVATNQRSTSRPPVTGTTHSPQPRATPFPPSSGFNENPPARRSAPSIPKAQTNLKPQDQNEQALIFIRAMINASKADGEVTEDEQRSILNELGDSSPAAINFLRQEFNRPVDVREFAWSVPMGLEQQVYTMSLLGMNLDSRREADYLAELAQGLRIAPDVCNQIHRRYGAPPIFED